MRLFEVKIITTVYAIEPTVQKLPHAELAEFRRRFAQFDEAAWNAQIERDAAAGKLDALAAEALADYHRQPRPRSVAQ